MIVPDNIKDLKVSGIYSIKSTINDRVYIGSSKNIRKRCSQHKSAIKYDKCNVKFKEFCKLYGKDNFKFEVLQLCDRKRLQTMEQLHIDVYKAYLEGFNVLPRAYSFSYYKRLGSKNSSHKLNESDVLLIKKALSYGYSTKHLYKFTDVSESTIKSIKLNNTWVQIETNNVTTEDIEDITKHFGGYKKQTQKLTKNEVVNIKNNNNLKNKELANKYNVSVRTIQMIKAGNTYKEIE